MVEEYMFDGWLLNIENPIDPELVPQLISLGIPIIIKSKISMLRRLLFSKWYLNLCGLQGKL